MSVAIYEVNELRSKEVAVQEVIVQRLIMQAVLNEKALYIISQNTGLSAH